MKKINFMVLFWGESYADFAANYMISSLLGNGNLELLNKEDGHTLICATDKISYERFISHKNAKYVGNFVNLRSIDIGEIKYSKNNLSSFDIYTENLKFMAQGFEKLLKEGYDKKSIGSVLNPDCIYTENYIKSLLLAENNGYDLLYTFSLRHSLEKFELHRSKFEIKKNEINTILSVPTNAGKKLFIDLLHPEMDIYNNNKFKPSAGDPFFFYKTETFLSINSYYCVPCMIRYSAIPEDHLVALKYGTYENEYIARNFNENPNIKALDPLEASILCLTHEDINWSPIRVSKASKLGVKNLIILYKNIKKGKKVYLSAGKSKFRDILIKQTMVFLSSKLSLRIFLIYLIRNIIFKIA